MRREWITVCVVLLASTVPALAQEVATEIQIVASIDDFTVNSDFSADQGDGGKGLLSWSNGGYAILHVTSGADKYYRVNMTGLWNDCTDLTQPNGPAKASFAAGDFTVVFYNLNDPLKLTPIANLSGSLMSGHTYNESETAENPSELYGAGVVKLDSWTVPGYQWAESLGSPAGITATTSDLVQWDVSDYQADWDSDNTIVTIMADESGIPEPATLFLLGLGVAGLLRRKSVG
jgi:hypothetical protein